MVTVEKLHPRYVTTEEGRQTDVILTIEEYNELLEDIEDIAVVAERINEPNIPHDKVLKELKEDGYLSD